MINPISISDKTYSDCRINRQARIKYQFVIQAVLNDEVKAGKNVLAASDWENYEDKINAKKTIIDKNHLCSWWTTKTTKWKCIWFWMNTGCKGQTHTAQIAIYMNIIFELC